jgi:hypothetical protein
VIDDGPFAACDGHDFPGLIEEGVPGIAAVIDDIVAGFEDSVQQPVLSHELLARPLYVADYLANKHIC